MRSEVSLLLDLPPNPEVDPRTVEVARRLASELVAQIDKFVPMISTMSRVPVDKELDEKGGISVLEVVATYRKLIDHITAELNNQPSLGL